MNTAAASSAKTVPLRFKRVAPRAGETRRYITDTAYNDGHLHHHARNRELERVGQAAAARDERGIDLDADGLEQ
jgi:hypothetical protein